MGLAAPQYNSKRPARILGLAVLLGTAFWLQAARISDVVVRSQVPDLDPESLRQLVVGSVQSLPGTTFDAAVLSEDVKRLYRLGTFQDVRYEVQEQAGDQVLIVFLVKPTPVVNAIVFEGNHAYKERRLRGLINHSTGSPLDEAQVARDRAALMDRYEDGGYYGTTVTTAFRPSADGQGVDVVFSIDEKPRAKLKAVRFTGASAFSARTLEKTVRSRRQWWRYIFRLGNYVNEPQFDLDKDLLRELYLTKGYLDFTVTGVDMQRSPNGRWVTLVFNLQEGQPYTVRSVAVDVEGGRFTREELQGLLTLRAGEVFSSTTERADLTALRGKYEPLGYLDLRCVSDLERQASDRSVAVTYRVREGSPSRIRDIHIIGNETTQDRVVRRELAIQPGDLGDASRIRTSKDRLSQLNYFETVEITPVATERDDLKDLRIQLSEKHTGTFSVGAGFSTEDSVVGYLELAENNFDISRLFGEWPPKGAGQRLRLRLSLGTETSDFRIDFTEPWFLERRLRLNVEIFNSTRSYDEYDQTDLGLGINLTSPLRTFWRHSYGVLFDRVKLDDFDRSPHYPDSDELDRTLASEEGSYWANRLTYGITRDTRDNVMFPRRGTRFSANSEWVTPLLGSYSNVMRLDTRMAAFFPVTRQSVLRLNAEYAVADNLSGDEVAIFDRYFAGGANSLRGFDYREVGPVDSGEDPVGGKSRLLANVELAREVGDFMYVYTFGDVGNVWSDAFQMKPSELNASVGVGLQLKVLPVRLEYGYPVMTDWDHLEGSSGRIHFNIGLSF